MAAGRHLGLDRPEMAPFDPPSHPSTKHEGNRVTRCWVMAIWSFSHLGRASDIRRQSPDIGDAGDFIFCPVLLCSALDIPVIEML